MEERENYWIYVSVFLGVVLVGAVGLIFKLGSDMRALKSEIGQLSISMTSVPDVTPTPTKKTGDDCEDVQNLSGYKYCQPTKGYGYILSSGGTRYNYVDKFSVSPSGEWLFLMKYTDKFIKEPFTPYDYDLVMVNIKKDLAYELLSSADGVSEIGDSWSDDGSAIAFAANPVRSKKGLEYKVYLCTTICKIVARNAGGEIVGNPVRVTTDAVVFDDPMGLETTVMFRK